METKHVCEKHELIDDVLGELQRDVREIRDALLGSYDTKGLVYRIYTVENKISELELVKKSIDKIVWKFVGAAVSGSGLTLVALKIISTLTRG